tara:strand:+ start:403 stop:1572 length:1170 start_codon:yes stop_codon:yes gene_type:complete
MKKKVLIVFKYPRGNWNKPVINKFSNYYDTEHLYISDYSNKNFTEVVSDINDLIKSKNIEIVVFDVDYFKFINFFFIESINCKKKILITGDDFELHEINSISASACDLVLSHCPFSVLKYREKGYQAHTIDYETGIVNKNVPPKKEIDVLFFGNITPGRKELLNYIVSEGVALKNIGYEKDTHGVAEEELTKLVSNSKIVLNLSKSRTTSVKSFASENIYKYYYQFKGRIIIAGLNGALCVSEYSPGQELLFQNNEIPTFFTKEQCVKILKELLSNEKLLLEHTKKFTLRSQELFEDKKSFEPIYNLIENIKSQKVKLIKIPYWYLRISAKQIILRNMKLFNLISSISQFKVIFKIIRGSNLPIKLLIISETILNILWYSFALTLKPKK